MNFKKLRRELKKALGSPPKYSRKKMRQFIKSAQDDLLNIYFPTEKKHSQKEVDSKR